MSGLIRSLIRNVLRKAITRGGAFADLFGEDEPPRIGKVKQVRAPKVRLIHAEVAPAPPRGRITLLHDQNPGSLSLFDEMTIASNPEFEREHPRGKQETTNPKTGKTIRPGQFAPKSEEERQEDEDEKRSERARRRSRRTPDTGGGGEVLPGLDAGEQTADVGKPGEQEVRPPGDGARRAEPLSADDGATHTAGSEPPRSEGDGAADVSDTPIGGGSAELSGLSGDAGSLQPELAPSVLNNFSTTEKSGNDFHILPEDQIGVGGPRRKMRENLAAIALLKQIEGEGRMATPEEQKILAHYTGWGWAGQMFHPNNDSANEDDWNAWKSDHDIVKAAMTPEEWAGATRSVTNAHYTATPVIGRIWEAVQRLGFHGGRILEPGAGVGNFFGLMPADMWARSANAAVELDTTSGRICKQLYQSAQVLVDGFERAPLPDAFFDLAISNVPFENVKVNDSIFAKLGLGYLLTSLHNYYFAKAMTKVRPGGLIAFITSSYTMDGKNAKRVREYLSANADFVGAIRLPVDAFKENAGTEVTTDIIFLRRRKPGEAPGGEAWSQLGEIDDPDGAERIQVNEYFAAHPEMMLGTMKRVGGRIVDQTHAECVAGEGAPPVDEAIAAAIAHLPTDIYSASAAPVRAPAAHAHGRNVGNYVLQNGKLYQIQPGPLEQISVDENGKPLMERKPPVMEECELQHGLVYERRVGLIGLRNMAFNLLDAQRKAGLSEEEVEGHRKKLNVVYDAFVAKHGILHLTGNLRAFAQDPDIGLISALENYNADTGVTRKADIFSKRTASPDVPVTHADSPSDALIHSLNAHGSINLGFIAQMTGQSVEEVQKSLLESGHIFRNPGGDFETRDEYLSGNVRRKLTEAIAAAAIDTAFAPNVEALNASQPVDLTPADIAVRLGTAWVPPEVFGAFLNHLTEEEESAAPPVTWNYIQSMGTWTHRVANKEVFIENNRTALTSQWGTESTDALELLSLAMNAKRPVVYAGSGDDRHVDKDATAAAIVKQKAIASEFESWVYQNDDRALSLSRIYNDTCNTDVNRTWDGSHLALPGFNDLERGNINSHVLNAVWRVLQSPNTLLHHCVGSGKTWAGAIAAMEMRRLGIARKPMIVVPNHLIPQWNDALTHLYPGANILMCTPADFTTEKRRALLARIATGDYDAVLITHSQFGLIPVTEDTEQKFFTQQMDEIDEVLASYLADNPDINQARDPTTKELVKAKARLQGKLEARIAKRKEDASDPIPFEHLGVDHIILDESHEYKNLEIATRRTRVKGLPAGGSDKAFDMYMKTQHVQAVNNGRGCLFMTGTPITNTMAEIYTQQRYLDGGRLKEAGLSNFDAWASVFGETAATIEQTADSKIKLTERFNHFFNMPELSTMYSRFADVKLPQDLNLRTPEVERIMVSCPPSEEQKAYVAECSARGDLIRKREVDPWIDNMPNVTTDMRMNALDVRLRQPHAPENPFSKAAMCANNVAREWKESADRRATQLIFLDTGTPKAGDEDSEDMTEAQKARKWTDKLKGADKGFAKAWLTWHLGVLKRKEYAAADEETRQAGKKPKKRKLAELGEEPQPEHYVMENKRSGEKTGVSNASDILDTIRDIVSGDTDPFSQDAETEDEQRLRSSVYQDIKDKLIARGIPEGEIAFIHDANTDAKKKALMARVSNGTIRVLLGSTAKMGTGMNVQEKLYCLHHIDAPWRPDQVEQREGRIIRQGNTHEKVKIYSYLTQAEGDALSADAFMWQTVRAKARMINQVLSARNGSRQTEDIGDNVLTYAQLQAIAGNNPLLMEHAQAAADLQDMETKASAHERGQWAAKARIATLPTMISAEEKAIKIAEHAVKFIEPKPKEFKASINGTDYDKVEEAGQAIFSLAGTTQPGVTRFVGNYRGADVYVQKPDFFILRPPGEQVESFAGSSFYNINTGVGVMSRINGAIDDVANLTTDKKLRVGRMKKEQEQLQGQLADFPEAEKLKAMRAHVAELSTKLGVGADDQEPVVVGDEEGNLAGAPPPAPEIDGEEASAPQSTHLRAPKANGLYVQNPSSPTGWEEVDGETLGADFPEIEPVTGAAPFGHAKKDGSYWTYAVVDPITGLNIGPISREHSKTAARATALQSVRKWIGNSGAEVIARGVAKGLAQSGPSPYRGGAWRDRSQATLDRQAEEEKAREQAEWETKTAGFEQDPHTLEILQSHGDDYSRSRALMEHPAFAGHPFDRRKSDLVAQTVNRYREGHIQTKPFPPEDAPHISALVNHVINRLVTDPRMQAAVEMGHDYSDTDGPYGAIYKRDFKRYLAESFAQQSDEPEMIQAYKDIADNPAFQKYMAEKVRASVVSTIQAKQAPMANNPEPTPIETYRSQPVQPSMDVSESEEALPGPVARREQFQAENRAASSAHMETLPHNQNRGAKVLTRRDPAEFASNASVRGILSRFQRGIVDSGTTRNALMDPLAEHIRDYDERQAMAARLMQENTLARQSETETPQETEYERDDRIRAEAKAREMALFDRRYPHSAPRATEETPQDVMPTNGWDTSRYKGVSVQRNDEHNGVELKFDGKPSDYVLGLLRAGGFRWSKFQKKWYAPHTDAAVATAHSIAQSHTRETNMATNDAFTRSIDIEGHPDMIEKGLVASWFQAGMRRVA